MKKKPFDVTRLGDGVFVNIAALAVQVWTPEDQWREFERERQARTVDAADLEEFYP